MLLTSDGRHIKEINKPYRNGQTSVHEPIEIQKAKNQYKDESKLALGRVHLEICSRNVDTN